MLRQNVDWTYEPARVDPSQSREASDLVAGSLFQKIQLARGVNEQSFAKSEIDPLSTTGRIRSYSDPFGVITSATEDESEIGRPGQSAPVEEMEAHLSIGMKSQSRRPVFVQKKILIQEFRSEKSILGKRGSSTVRNGCSDGKTKPSNGQSDCISRIYAGEMLNNGL